MSPDEPDRDDRAVDAAPARRRRRRVRISLASLVAVVTLATGVLTLRDQLFPRDDGDPVVVVAREAREIPRFDGVAGHLAEARAFVDFLDQHDDDTVYLRVGFPKLAQPGPIGGDNGVTETISQNGRTKVVIRELALMTKCSSDLPLTEENPTPRDGCTGTSLAIQGEETEDSGTFFEHGVPVVKGYFKVNVTGGLHMGLAPSS